MLFFDGSEFLHSYTPGFAAAQIGYLSSDLNELLLRSEKEVHVLDLRCFPLKIKKTSKIPDCYVEKLASGNIIPLRKAVARKGNKTGYIYYEDNILKKERHIYSEKAFINCDAILDLLFSKPKHFFCKIKEISKGSSVHRKCPVCSSRTDIGECTDCKRTTEVIVCKPKCPSVSNRKPKYNQPRTVRKPKNRRQQGRSENQNADSVRKTMTALMSVATLLSVTNLPEAS